MRLEQIRKTLETAVKDFDDGRPGVAMCRVRALVNDISHRCPPGDLGDFCDLRQKEEDALGILYDAGQAGYVLLNDCMGYRKQPFESLVPMGYASVIRMGVRDKYAITNAGRDAYRRGERARVREAAAQMMRDYDQEMEAGLRATAQRMTERLRVLNDLLLRSEEQDLAKRWWGA